MPKSISLDDLFPAVPPGTRRSTPNHGMDNPVARGELPGSGIRHKEGIRSRWTAVYALELRGLDQKQIAAALNLSPATVCKIVNDPRYIAYREEHITALDAEFVQMKPLAFKALKDGLKSTDENTALRASEQWFKGAGFGGFAKEPPASRGVTAEDVAAQLLASVQLNVQVNVDGKG